MMSPDEIARLIPAETAKFRSPIPTQPVSSDEFVPGPQSPKQREFEARVKQIGSELAKKQGVSRRTFFQSAAGMAAAFVAMNDTFGPMYAVSRAEAATPEMANERANALKGQFIMDMHTHFLRDDTRLEGFVRSREAVGKASWNPALVDKLAAMIAESKRPIILAGHGILISGAERALLEFARTAQIPVAWTLLGIGAVDESDPLAYGYMGMHGWKHVNRAIQSADLLIAIGMRFDDRVTGNVRTFAPYARIVHADIDPAEIGKNVSVEVPIVGDAKRVLAGLTELALGQIERLLISSGLTIPK